MNEEQAIQVLMEQQQRCVKLVAALTTIRNVAIEHCLRHDFAKIIARTCDDAMRHE